MADLPPDGPERVLAVQALFVRHANALRGLLLRLVPDFALAEDVLQEVFLVVTAKAGEFRGGEFQAWAWGIARRKALELGRRLGPRPGVLAPATMDALCAEEPPPAEGDPELQQRLRDCIARLAPAARRIVELRYADGLDPAQVAQRMAWTAQAVYVALSRARAALRRCLDARGARP